MREFSKHVRGPFRREFLKAGLAGCVGWSASGWFSGLAQAHVKQATAAGRHCILLWMSGGPSQLDTFDLKPGHANGGEFKEIASSVPGVRFSEHLPRLSKLAEHLAIVRSLSTKEGDHERGTHVMKTGFAPTGVVEHPALAASIAKELQQGEMSLPAYVSISPVDFLGRMASGAGYLGPRYAPLLVSGVPGTGEGFASLNVQSIKAPAGVDEVQMSRRMELWRMLQDDFAINHPNSSVQAHQVVYENALKLVHSSESEAFDLSREENKTRERYGRGLFGQGCLLARRLVERGVRFVEVSLTTSSRNNYTWDSHAENFAAVRELSADLDAGFASLVEDLAQRGLLEKTTIVWMGEFGRTPKINGQAGRDHFPRAWSCVFAGGGINGGQVIGKTSDDGMDVVDGKVGVSDVLASMCAAVGVPADTKQMSNLGRPLPMVEGSPIAGLVSL